VCLAVPSQVVSIDDARMATVSVMGVERTCSLRLVPDVQVGDYVLVHAGFAIQRVEEQDAAETLKLFAEMPDLLGDELTAEINALEPGRVAEAQKA
jgi:hydrogenase expression/formation protein HypC